MTRTHRIPVAILGATGVVGQRLVALLAHHPVFEAAELIASDRSAGRAYGDAVDWRLPDDLPRSARDRVVLPLDVPAIRSPIVLSALSASLAEAAEEELAGLGKAVVSNASAHRMDADVPLLIPEINPGHVNALSAQRRRREGPGFIVTNPNCSTVAVAFALAPLHRAFGVRRACIVTLQALSGAGLPGVPARAMADNVIPHIEGEAAKIETEPLRILGRWDGDRFEDAAMILGAQVHRVGVSDGHLAAISLETARPCAPEDAARVLAEFRGEPQELRLPSAPERPIHVLAGARPQPALDRGRERGMAVSVGSIARCPVLSLRLEALVHNTIRGAAGAALLNAEWLHARGLLDEVLAAHDGGPR
jgi:aspartate-semialdehyde dehydrogenase